MAQASPPPGTLVVPGVPSSAAIDLYVMKITDGTPPVAGQSRGPRVLHDVELGPPVPDSVRVVPELRRRPFRPGSWSSFHSKPA